MTMFKCNSCDKQVESEESSECCGTPMVEVQAEATEAPAEEEKKEESSE